MSRFYLYLIVIPFVFFTAVLLLIHIQPYDDREASQLLLQDDCSLPCFIGIRPGVTTVDEAYQRLSESVWIERLSKRVFNDLYGSITWTWSPQTPRWIAADSKGEVQIRDHLVTSIIIPTNLLLGDTRLIFGIPDTEVLDTTADHNRYSIYYYALYRERGLSTQNWLPCSIMDALHRPVVLTIGQSTGDARQCTHSFNDLSHTCT